MIEKLNQYKKLIGAVFLTLLVLVGIGYLFADKKSEPVYLSKIDKLMFDDENKAPKFILTLPDYQPGKKNEVVEKKPEAEEPKIEIDKVPESKPKPEKERTDDGRRFGDGAERQQTGQQRPDAISAPYQFK